MLRIIFARDKDSFPPQYDKAAHKELMRDLRAFYGVTGAKLSSSPDNDRVEVRLYQSARSAFMSVLSGSGANEFVARVLDSDPISRDRHQSLLNMTKPLERTVYLTGDVYINENGFFFPDGSKVYDNVVPQKGKEPYEHAAEIR